MSGGESNGSGIGATLSAGLDIYNFVDSLLFAKTFKNVTKAAERVMPPPGNEVKSFWFANISERSTVQNRLGDIGGHTLEFDFWVWDSDTLKYHALILECVS